MITIYKPDIHSFAQEVDKIAYCQMLFRHIDLIRMEELAVTGINKQGHVIVYVYNDKSKTVINESYVEAIRILKAKKLTVLPGIIHEGIIPGTPIL